MMGKRWQGAVLVAFLFTMGGCFSCSSSDDDISIDVDDDGIGTTNPLFNGLTCETTTSSWQCEADDGTSLRFAIYFFTFRGIAVMTPPQGTPSQVAFTWVQPTSTRVEITTDDEETLVADDVDGSINERFLSFVLSGGEEPTRSFNCTLDTENVLDQDCNEQVDSLPTATPTVVASSTATPTATPTVSISTPA
jgi:hypothetical protein